MDRGRSRCLLVASAGALILLQFLSLALNWSPVEREAVLAGTPDHPAFERTWARTDRPMADGQIARTWMWGPEPFTSVVFEEYAESPNGVRLVQYFDKARMEITHPDAVDDGLWYVTNGLLVVELITGDMQVGDGEFVAREPAEVNVAGDPDDRTGPTYATFRQLLDAPALASGAGVMQRLDRTGRVTDDDALALYGVTSAFYVPETAHAVASPFWTFMNSSGLIYKDGEYVTNTLFANPFYATGFPITEAYWTTVAVGGTAKDVLVQCFQRRCLTYTPGNPVDWRVEAGNVGQHYYMWRTSSGGDGSTPAATPTTTPAVVATPISSPTSTPAPTSTPTPTATPTSTPTPTPEPLPETPFAASEAECLNAEEAEFLRLINEYRVAHDAPELTVSVKLNRASYGYSYDMGDRDYFYQTGDSLAHQTKEPYPEWLGGPMLSDRLSVARYTGWTGIDENILGSTTANTAKHAFDLWKSSTTYRQIMLNAEFTQIGIGFAYVPGGTYRYYWTTDFGDGNDQPPTSCP